MLYIFFIYILLATTLQLKLNDDVSNDEFKIEDGIEVYDGFYSLIQNKTALLKICWENAINFKKNESSLAYAKFHLVKQDEAIELGTYTDVTGFNSAKSKYSHMLKAKYDVIILENIEEAIDGFSIRVTFMTRDRLNISTVKNVFTTLPLIVQTPPKISCSQEGVNFKNLTTVVCSIACKKPPEYRIVSAVMGSSYEIVKLYENRSDHVYHTKIEINFFPDSKQQNEVIVVDAFVPELIPTNSSYFSYHLSTRYVLKLRFLEHLNLKCENWGLKDDRFNLICHCATFQTPDVHVETVIPSKYINIEKTSSSIYDITFMISIDADLDFINKNVTVVAFLGKSTVAKAMTVVILEKSPPFKTKFIFGNDENLKSPFKCNDIFQFIKIDCNTHTAKGNATISIYSPDGFLVLQRNSGEKTPSPVLKAFGYWKCVAKNEYGSSVSKMLVTVEDVPCFSKISVETKFKITKINDLYIIPESKKARFKCIAYNNMQPMYYILMEEDTPIARNDNGLFYSDNISFVTGNYKCVSINPVGFKESNYVSIYIETPPGLSKKKMYSLLTMVLILGFLCIVISSIAICIRKPTRAMYYKIQ